MMNIAQVLDAKKFIKDSDMEEVKKRYEKLEPLKCDEFYALQLAIKSHIASGKVIGMRLENSFPKYKTSSPTQIDLAHTESEVFSFLNN